MGDGYGWQLDYPYSSSFNQHSESNSLISNELKQPSIVDFIQPTQTINGITLPLDLEIKDCYCSDYKGFLFEMQVIQQLAQIPYIILDTNPTNYEGWKHQKHKRSYDISVTYKDGTKEYIECKYRKGGFRVYNCWYSDDWAPRDCNRYTTNNVEAIGYDNKRDIDAKDRVLSSVSETVVDISKKAVKIHKKLSDCNQLSSWNNLIDTIITSILDNSSKIINKLSNSKFRIRLESSLLGLKSSVKAKLAKSHLMITQLRKLRLYSLLAG
jgi:hypothetical protein